MKKKLIFKGTATALITPFKNGEIDFLSLRNIIDFQIDSGIDALVIAGTTGEASTLSENERYSLFDAAYEYTAGRVPLVLGTGCNDTKKAAECSKHAKQAGADAILVVTPYYNKGTEEGIKNHYLSIAEAVDLPIILYNVPSRTSVNLSINNIKELSKHENIVAIKEASDSLDRLVHLSMLEDDITLYSGNDSQLYTNLTLGGMGIISVASNIIPKEFKKMTDSYFCGRSDITFGEQKRLLPFINSLFLETNPAGIKYAMSLCGLCESEIRLPLTLPCTENRKIVEEELLKIRI